MASISFNRKLRTRSKRVRVCTFVVYFSNGCCIIFTSSTNSIRALTWTHSNYKRYGALSVCVCVCIYWILICVYMPSFAVVIRSWFRFIFCSLTLPLFVSISIRSLAILHEQSQVGYCNHIHGINSGSKMAIAFVHGSKSTCKSIQ